MNIEALKAHIKGLNEKIEKAANEALEKGGFGDNVDRVKGWMAELSDAKSTLAACQESKGLMDSIRGLGGETPEDRSQAAAKSLGEHVVKSIGAQLAGMKGQTGSVAAPEWLGVKTASDPHTTPSIALPYSTEYIPGLETVRTRIQVGELFQQGSTDTSAVSWLREGQLDGSVGAVEEGKNKPQIHMADPELVTEAYKKIAGVIQYSDEMLEDFAFLVSEINGRGVYELELAEEKALVNGDGTGANIRGILSTSGIQAITKGTDTTADAIFKAASAVARAADYTADGIIMSVEDYTALRLAKDKNDQYYGGGIFAPAYASQGGVNLFPNVWGLSTVVTSAIPKGTAVVGAFKTCATFYKRGGIRVESTVSHGDTFINNIVTTRIERRALLAVRKPLGFAKVDLSQ
nr:MAG TPA: major capsid protein [Caudoviricetes sp.]